MSGYVKRDEFDAEVAKFRRLLESQGIDLERSINGVSNDVVAAERGWKQKFGDVVTSDKFGEYKNEFTQRFKTAEGSIVERTRESLGGLLSEHKLEIALMLAKAAKNRVVGGEPKSELNIGPAEKDGMSTKDSIMLTLFSLGLAGAGVVGWKATAAMKLAALAKNRIDARRDAEAAEESVVSRIADRLRSRVSSRTGLQDEE